jgi:hypothetical protein
LAPHNSRYNFSHSGSRDRSDRIGSIYVQAEHCKGTIDGNLGTRDDRGVCDGGAKDDDEESEVTKEKTTKKEGNEQRSLARPRARSLEDGIPMGQVNKKERLTFDGRENLTRFMVSPQHSMGDGYARTIAGTARR